MLSYAEFERQVACMAGALRSRHGLAPGTRVALAMENCPEFLPALYGVWRAGLSAVPINSKLHAREMAWIMADSQSQAVPRHAQDRRRAVGARHRRSCRRSSSPARRTTRRCSMATRVAPLPGDPDAEAWMFYTSGTTGRPKGAMLSHRNLLFACHCYYADIDHLGPGDAILHAAPLTHGSGLYGLAHIARGSNNVILPGSFEPERVFDALARHANVSMFAAPTMVARLINHPRRRLGRHARPQDHHLRRRADVCGRPRSARSTLFGPKLYHLYGQGESPMTISGLDKALHADTDHPRYEERLASAGVARTGVAIRIVDEAGRELPAGEVGEVVTTSDCVMKGYWNNDGANAQALRDGWLWTGDLGSMDADGFVTLKDRSKDLIISGGANIYPREIEEVLLTHAGRAGDRRGQPPACRLGRGGDRLRRQARGRRRHGAPSSISLCLDNIARFKRPKGYRFVEALPKNNYGKILKTELREQAKQEQRVMSTGAHRIPEPARLSPTASPTARASPCRPTTPAAPWRPCAP